jgi:hypothetical protein
MKVYMNHKHLIIEQTPDWSTVDPSKVTLDGIKTDNGDVIKTNTDADNKKITVIKKDKDKWGRLKGDKCYGLSPEECKKKFPPPPPPPPKPIIDPSKVASATKQFALIQNAVQFIENMQRVRILGDGSISNRPENNFIKFSFSTRVSGSNPEEQTAYISMLYRILHDQKMQSLRKKYKKEYDYWLSRNYASSTSWDYLKRLHSEVTWFSGWFSPQISKDIEWDMKYINRYFDRIFSNINSRELKNKWVKNPYQLKLKKIFSNDQIHNMVMDAYKNKIWGEPFGSRQNMGWIQTKAATDNKKKK